MKLLKIDKAVNSKIQSMNSSALEENWENFSDLWKDVLKVHQIFLENKISFAQLLDNQENFDCFKAHQNILNREFKSDEVSINFSKLIDLDFLWLSYLKIGALSPVQFLSNIQSIRLYWMFTVPDIQPIANLTKLQYLEMVGGEIKDLSPLQNLQNLEILKCTAQEKVTNLKPIASLINLKELYIGHTSVKNLKPIVTLKNLQKLSLYDNKVTDISPLIQLENLQHLDLQHTRISSIQQLPKNLKQLLCGTSYISKAEMKAFVETHPECKVNDGEDYWKLNEPEEILELNPYQFKAGFTILNLDEIRAISFIGLEDENQYFTIQYTVGEQDDHIELNSQAYGTYNGVEKVISEKEKVIFALSKEGKKQLHYSQIEILLEASDDEWNELQKELKKIYKKHLLHN